MLARAVIASTRRGALRAATARRRALMHAVPPTTSAGVERLPTEDLFVRPLESPRGDPEVELLVKEEMQTRAEKAAAEEICPERLDRAHRSLDAALAEWRDELADELDVMVAKGALPPLTEAQKAALVDWNVRSE